jgi:hypothetical protein
MNNPEKRIQLDLSSCYILDFTFRYLRETLQELEPVSNPLWLFREMSRLQRGWEMERSRNLRRLQIEFLEQYPGTFGLNHHGEMEEQKPSKLR